MPHGNGGILMRLLVVSDIHGREEKLERVMKDLRELNPEAQIMILSYNNPVPLMPSWSRHFRRLNTAAAKLAAQYDVTYVPIPYTRTANDGHPTVSGHKYIGRQILKAVNY